MKNKKENEVPEGPDAIQRSDDDTQWAVKNSTGGLAGLYKTYMEAADAKRQTKEGPGPNKLPYKKMAFGGEVDGGASGEWEPLNAVPDQWNVQGSNAPAHMDTQAGKVELPQFRTIDQPPAEMPDDMQKNFLKNFNLPPGSPLSVPPTTPASSVDGASSPGMAPRTTAVPGKSLEDELAASDRLLGTGPGQRTALLQALQKYQQGGRGWEALAGVGDAISSGVTLGAVNPHNADSIEKMLADRSKQSLDVQGEQLDQNKTRLSEGRQMEAKDPNSNYSRQYQQATNKMLASTGSKMRVDGMSAEEIQSRMPTMATLIDSMMQNNFHMGELGTQEKDAQRKVLSDRISKDLELIKEAKGFLPAIGIGAVTHKDSNKALADITEAQHELAALDGSPAPASGAGHPDAQAALQWAQANPTDPRAAEILKRLGH